MFKNKKTHIAAAPLCAIAIATTAAAHDTDAEFKARLQSFLMQNPEVILEAMTALGERERRAAQNAAIAEFPGLFAEPAILGMGDTAAPLRVIEFFDYRCAPCKAIHPGLSELVEQTPNLRIEMRQLPILSPGSERSARFALAVNDVAGAEAYARVHERLWTLRGPMNAASFEVIADDENLDWAHISEAMQSDAVTTRIDENRDIAIALEILGTPAFVTPNSISFGQSDIEALADTWLNQ